MSRRPFLVAALVAAALAGAGSTPASAATVRSIADGLPILSAEAAGAKLDAQRPQLCAAKPSKARTPSLRAALAQARKVVRRGKGAAADRRFRKSRDGRSVERALAAAGAAATAGRSTAALAALLRAHELRPRDQRPLVSAATVLVGIGRAPAALALLDAAAKRKAPKGAPLGSPRRALLANARGHALLALGRWKDAERALRPAVASAPLLREARANLAHAQLCAGNRAAAARTAAAATRRAGAPSATTSSDPDSGGPVVVQAATPLWLDVAPGVLPTLPTWRIPANEAEARALRDALRAQHDGDLPAIRQAVAATSAASQASRPVRQALSAAGTSYLRALDVAFARPERQPGLRERWEAMGARWRVLNDFHTRFGAGQAGPTCGAFAGWRQAYLDYEDAARQYIREQYRYHTGIAANVADPRLHAEFMARARQSLVVPMQNLHQASSYLAEYGSNCFEGEAASVGLDETPGDTPESAKCPTGLTSVAFRWALPGVEVSVSCEAVGVELEAGSAWLTGFVNVSHRPGTGETTVVVGPRAKTPSGPFGPSAQVEDGLYITVAGDGTIRDVGARVSHTAVLQVGPGSVALSGESMDFSLVGVSPLGAILGD